VVSAAAGAGAAGVALAASLALELQVERAVFPLLMAAVVITAWWGGVPAGLAASVLGGLGTAYYFEEPRNSLAVTNLRTPVDWGLFGLATVLVSGLRTHLRAVSGRADRARREADAGAEALSRLAAIVSSSDDAIIGKTLDGTITSWNPAAELLYGHAPADIIGRPISVLVPPDHADEIPAILERIRAGEGVQHFETVRQRKDGRRVEISVSVSPVRDASGRITGAASVARDISERKRLESENQALLRSRANTDGLTGLANRGSLDGRAIELIALARRHGRPLSCLMIDIDHFKRVNDTHGHAGGDAVLCEVASRLRHVCRASDMVGRYGGEEFTALLPETDAEGALAVAEKIRATVAAAPVVLPSA